MHEVAGGCAGSTGVWRPASWALACAAPERVAVVWIGGAEAAATVESAPASAVAAMREFVESERGKAGFIGSDIYIKLRASVNQFTSL